MRLISLLLGLVILAYFISKQLASNKPESEITQTLDQQEISTPRVPTTPQDVKKFEANMNDFMQDAAEKRAKALEKIEDATNQ